MISDKKNEANRANAQLSTGPVTPEGKEASSRNATKHGFASRRLVLKPGQEAEFNNLHESLISSWNPIDAQESVLVLHIAEATWRYELAQGALDQLMFSASAAFHEAGSEVPDQAADALALQNHGKSLLLYQRYATGFERTMVRLIAALRHLQAFRIKKQTKELDAERSDQIDWNNYAERAITTPFEIPSHRLSRLTPNQATRYNQALEETKKLKTDS